MTVIVPARNEVELLPTTLPTLLALLAQDYPGVWWVVLVDDRSNDGTAAIARGSATGRLTPGRPPPPRWLVTADMGRTTVTKPCPDERDAAQRARR